MNFKNTLIGALSGLLSAILVDLHAWSKSDYGVPFDFRTAVTRWAGGLASGATAGWSIQ